MNATSKTLTIRPGVLAARGSRSWRQVEAGLILLAWTLVGLLFASTFYFRGVARGEPISVGQAAMLAAVDVYSWAVVTLVAFRAARRFPLEGRFWMRHAAVHAALGLALVTGRAVVAHLYLQSTGRYPEYSWLHALISYVPFNFVSYWLLLGVAHAVEYARRFQERELSAAHLETQLTRAQLQMLKVQIHPHFLFNTLHAISTLVRRDPDAAERMIANLSELLRSALAHQQAQEVSVAEEMDLLEPYLEIEKTRLGERLTLGIEVEPGAREARIPHLILQPLVENAIRHGIAPRRGGGRVGVCIRRVGDRLEIRVEDNGLGIPGRVAAARRGGVGLPNTRARLQQLYGSGHRFSLSSTTGQGTTVEISIPYRVDGPAPLALSPQEA